MSKIMSKPNTPEFNAQYDRIFNDITVDDLIDPRMLHGNSMQSDLPGDLTQKDRLAKLNKSYDLMKNGKSRNNRFTNTE